MLLGELKPATKKLLEKEIDSITPVDSQPEPSHEFKFKGENL